MRDKEIRRTKTPSRNDEGRHLDSCVAHSVQLMRWVVERASKCVRSSPKVEVSRANRQRVLIVSALQRARKELVRAPKLQLAALPLHLITSPSLRLPEPL